MEKDIKIKDMRMLVTPYPTFIDKNTKTDDVAKTLIVNPGLKTVYVVDNELKLLGGITLKKLIRQEFSDLLPSNFEYFGALDFIGKNTAFDMMEPLVYVKDDDTLKTAFIKMYENDLDELPVVNSSLQLIGNIDLLELLTILIEKKEQQSGKKFLCVTTNRPFYKRFK
jgi:CBS domain-containing protein